MRLFLFDFDGVLVESLDVYEKTVKQCLDNIGHPIIKSREDFLALFDINFYEAIAEKGVDLKVFMDASAGVLSNVDYNQIRPFPAIFPMLEKLGKNNILIVISSNETAAIRIALSLYHFNGCFREILGSDFMFSKSEKIAYAIEKYGIDGENTYYIGDTVGDIVEAKKAGVRSVAVTWGWHSGERLQTSNPEYLVRTPEELLTICETGCV